MQIAVGIWISFIGHLLTIRNNHLFHFWDPSIVWQNKFKYLNWTASLLIYLRILALMFSVKLVIPDYMTSIGLTEASLILVPFFFLLDFFKDRYLPHHPPSMWFSVVWLMYRCMIFMCFLNVYIDIYEIYNLVPINN
jgi:hypothetical protein